MCPLQGYLLLTSQRGGQPHLAPEIGRVFPSLRLLKVPLRRTPDVVYQSAGFGALTANWWRFKSWWVLRPVDRLLTYVLSKRRQVFASRHVLISQKAQTFVSVSNIGPNLVYFPSFIHSFLSTFLPTFLPTFLYEYFHPDMTSVSVCICFLTRQ